MQYQRIPLLIVSYPASTQIPSRILVSPGPSNSSRTMNQPVYQAQRLPIAFHRVGGGNIRPKVKTPKETLCSCSTLQKCYMIQILSRSWTRETIMRV